MVHYNEFRDEKKTRKFTTVIGKDEYETIVEITMRIPLLVADDTKMESKFTISKQETAISQLGDITFKDDSYGKQEPADEEGVDKKSKAATVERFITIGVSTSKLNDMDVVLLYDKKYKDVIVFASPIDYKTIKVDYGRIYFKGYALGTNAEPEYHLVSTKFDPVNHTYPLPETNANLSLTNRIVSIPDVTRIDRGSGGINTFEKMDGDYNIQYGTRGHTSMLDLGTTEALFKGEGKIPVYLLRQSGFLTYDFVFAGHKSKEELKGKRLYLLLNY